LEDLAGLPNLRLDPALSRVEGLPGQAAGALAELKRAAQAVGL